MTSNSDLNRFRQCAVVDKLVLNAGKSKAMVISESEINVKFIVDSPIVSQEVIHYVWKAKVLGLWKNNTVSWSDQDHQKSVKKNLPNFTKKVTTST